MAPHQLQNRDIVSFLKETRFSGGFFDTLKIRYRTYICPFIDLIQKVKPGDKVGDVGCGSGQFLLLLSQFADNPKSLYGIEISQHLIANAHKLFSKNNRVKSEFETFDGIHFPGSLKDCDLIYLIDVLHHVPKENQKQFLTDLCTLMKPGARMVLKDINKSSPLVLFNKMHDLIFAGEIGNEWKMQDAKSLLEQNDMKILENYKRRMYVYPHYTIVAQKN